MAQPRLWVLALPPAQPCNLDTSDLPQVPAPNGDTYLLAHPSAICPACGGWGWGGVSLFLPRPHQYQPPNLREKESKAVSLHGLGTCRNRDPQVLAHPTPTADSGGIGAPSRGGSTNQSWAPAFSPDGPRGDTHSEGPLRGHGPGHGQRESTPAFSHEYKHTPIYIRLSRYVHARTLLPTHVTSDPRAS